MRKPFLILLALLALFPPHLPADSPQPLAVHEWDARPADPRPYLGRVPHGSAALLVARLPAAPESAAFLWQTNGMASLWWEAPAECSSNAVSVLWTPEMDCGADEYRAFFRIEQPEGPDYGAVCNLAMLDSPGFAPNALPMPVERLDFAAVPYTNAPWATRSELRDATNALVIAAVDLSPYATWQGLDDATAAAAAEVAEVAAAIAGKADARRRIDAWRCEWDGATLLPVSDMPGALRKYTADARDTTDQRMLFFYPADGWTILDDTWYLYPQNGQSAAIACEAAPDAAALVFERGESQYRLDLVEERAAYIGDIPSSPADIGAATADGLSGLSAELDAIRAAADEIELPEDPTAAELGAAFRELLLCIRNPAGARALRKAKGTAR